MDTRIRSKSFFLLLIAFLLILSSCKKTVEGNTSPTTIPNSSDNPALTESSTQYPQSYKTYNLPQYPQATIKEVKEVNKDTTKTYFITITSDEQPASAIISFFESELEKLSCTIDHPQSPLTVLSCTK